MQPKAGQGSVTKIEDACELFGDIEHLIEEANIHIPSFENRA